jgi:hypothetical protein
LNVMGSYPTGAQDYTNPASGNTMPVHRVSWEDIRGVSATYDWPTISTVGSSTFMGNLLAKTGLPFDLPTEAEWEYTCRAGTTTIWSYGDTEDGDYMWYTTNNTPSGTKEVGGKLPVGSRIDIVNSIELFIVRKIAFLAHSLEFAS